MFSPKKDLTILLVIAVFLAAIVLIALYTSPITFWYSQIVLQLVMATIALWISFGGGDRQ